MKLLLVIGVLSLVLSVSYAESSGLEEHVDWEDHNEIHEIQNHEKQKGGRCQGVKNVDLSEFNLKTSDLKEHVARTSRSIFEKQQDGEQFPYASGDGTVNDIKTRVTDIGMGVIRKVVVTSDKKKILAKVMKTGKSSGDFSTSVSGSANTSREASTSGKANFELDLQIFSTKGNANKVVTGDVGITHDSTTSWVKKGNLNVLQSKSNTSSDIKLSWSDTAKPEKSGSMTMNSLARATSGTVFVSKHCFVTGVGVGFKASSSGTNWSSSILGGGRGKVFTRVLYATDNGTSLTWSFAKLKLRTKLEVVGKNGTVTGTQNITIVSFTETITRPGPPQDGQRVLEVSNEIKLRVGVNTTLSTGSVIYAAGGQLVFRSINVKIPSHTAPNSQGGEDSEDAQVIAGNVLQKQAQGDEILVNPDFVNSVVATPIS